MRHVLPLVPVAALVLAACGGPTTPPFPVGKKWDYYVGSLTKPGDLRIEGSGSLEVLSIDGTAGEVRLTVTYGATPSVVRTIPVSYPAGKPFEGLALPFQSKATPDAVATEAVTVPAGTFTAEKRSASETRADGSRLATEVWVAPDAPPPKVVHTDVKPGEGGETTTVTTWLLQAR